MEIVITVKNEIVSSVFFDEDPTAVDQFCREEDADGCSIIRFHASQESASLINLINQLADYGDQAGGSKYISDMDNLVKDVAGGVLKNNL